MFYDGLLHGCVCISCKMACDHEMSIRLHFGARPAQVMMWSCRLFMFDGVWWVCGSILAGAELAMMILKFTVWSVAAASGCRRCTMMVCSSTPACDLLWDLGLSVMLLMPEFDGVYISKACRKLLDGSTGLVAHSFGCHKYLLPDLVCLWTESAVWFASPGWCGRQTDSHTDFHTVMISLRLAWTSKHRLSVILFCYQCPPDWVVLHMCFCELHAMLSIWWMQLSRCIHCQRRTDDIQYIASLTVSIMAHLQVLPAEYAELRYSLMNVCCTDVTVVCSSAFDITALHMLWMFEWVDQMS